MPLLDTTLAWGIIEPEWSACIQNFQLTQYLKSVQDVLRAGCGTVNRAEPQPARSLEGPVCARTAISNVVPDLRQLLSQAIASKVALDNGREAEIQIQQFSNQKRPDHSLKDIPATEELRRALQPFTTSSNATRRRYGKDLEDSLDSFAAIPRTTISSDISPMLLSAQIDKARIAAQHAFDVICATLQRGESLAWLHLAGLLPRLTPTTILACVRSCERQLPKIAAWLRLAIIAYGIRLRIAETISHAEITELEGHPGVEAGAHQFRTLPLVSHGPS